MAERQGEIVHIVIGLITALGGLVWALYRLQSAGVDLNGFNPFAWMRRRKWEKKLGTKPMHALTSSMQAAGLLIVAVAKEHGDVTRESKLEILVMFEKEFGLSRSKALEMYSSSMYLLQGALNMAAEVKDIVEPSQSEFTEENITKLLTMLKTTAQLEEMTDGQRDIISAVEQVFEKSKEQNW